MVHDTIDPLHGGSIERSMQVSKSLAERGYQIDLLSLKRNFNLDYAKKNGIKDIYIYNSIKLKYLLPIINPITLMKLCKEYEIIHISKNWSMLSFFVALIAKKIKVPYIFSPMGWVSFTNNKSEYLKKIYFKYCTKFILINCYYTITVSENEYKNFNPKDPAALLKDLARNGGSKLRPALNSKIERGFLKNY